MFPNPGTNNLLKPPTESAGMVIARSPVLNTMTSVEVVRSAAAYGPWRPAVAELFSKSFQRPFPEKAWDLYYRDNPYGEVIAAIALSGDKVVGHHAFIPQVLTRGDGQVLRYLQSISLMTDPGHRNVFLKLVAASHTAAMKSDADFILSFNNPHGARPLRELFGHQPIVETPLLTWTPQSMAYATTLRISPAEKRAYGDEFTHPWCAQYWNWRTSLNGAKAVRLNDRTQLTYKISEDVITVLDLETGDQLSARDDLTSFSFHLDAPHFRISAYHAELIETFSNELVSHEDYVLRFYGRKLRRPVPPIRFSLLLSDVF